MRVAVYGLWHLGCVTAACLAKAGHQVIALDTDLEVVAGLCAGRAPLHEPGLDDLIATTVQSGYLTFSTEPSQALADAEVLWVTFDTPVNDADEADVAWVRTKLESIVDALRPGTLILISAQVPVGFSRSLANDWDGLGLHFACSPENLRLGKAIEAFCEPERVVIGIDDESQKERLSKLFAPFCDRLIWMSIESAEMTKHALNAFLATSVTFINELARICETVGADAKEVERGLKSEGRIGPRAYLSPGAAFAGGTLARDLRFLQQRGSLVHVATPLVEGVLASNEEHKGWVRERTRQLLTDMDRPVVAMLGLTYKAGTSTLRRSSAVELCQWLHNRGVEVRGYDPAIAELPAELDSVLQLTHDPLQALDGADLAVIATGWPEFRTLKANELHARMRHATVLDPTHFLGDALRSDPRVRYIATGRAA